MIIDIHSHIKRNYRNPEEEEKKLLADMDKHGIDIRVVSALEGVSVEEANQYISDLVSRYPKRLAGCAVINPKEADCAKKAEEALSLPGIVMLEFNSLEHGYYPDSRDGVEAVLDEASRKKVPVKVFSGIGSRAMPQQWLGHVRKHPELAFIFLHMGCFDYGYGCVDLALEYPNIYLETSNQYEVQILKKAVSSVPKEKLLFGSLWPERLTGCSLDIFDMFHLEEEAARAVFGENAARLLRLDKEGANAE
nr:amidohydrolase family protein [uncultured Merdimonas sp.]